MQFRPRILDIRHNYSRQRLVGDLGAGATVGVVALPLAMAFAIASGLPPPSRIVDRHHWRRVGLQTGLENSRQNVYYPHPS